MTDFDVLIAGSGPAGCATALSLAAFAPELRVGLIAAPEKGEERIGETVPPQISPVLVHLGLWDAFSRGGHCPSYRTMAAWGDSQLGGNEFLLHAHQVGWRLDRPAFDRMLVEAASARVAAFIQAKVVSLARETGDWRVLLFDGTRPTADFLVDATGRAAALARRCGLRPVNIDRLVGCSLRVGSRSDGTEGLMIESCAEGWWYTAAIPSGDRVIVCMTDADRVRPLGLSSGRGFTRLFAETCHVRRVAILEGVGDPLSGRQAAGSLIIRPPSRCCALVMPRCPLIQFRVTALLGRCAPASSRLTRLPIGFGAPTRGVCRATTICNSASSQAIAEWFANTTRASGAGPTASSGDVALGVGPSLLSSAHLKGNRGPIRVY